MQDPNYHCNDDRKHNLFTKEMPNTTIKIVSGSSSRLRRRRRFIVLFFFDSTFLWTAEAGSRVGEAPFCFLSIFLLSCLVLNVRCISKWSRNVNEMPCSHRIGYNVGAITGVSAKNNSRKLHLFCASILIVEKKTASQSSCRYIEWRKEIICNPRAEFNSFQTS